jgi:hypothetical protein
MLLHRPGPGRRPKVAGRLELRAPDAAGARRAAERALRERAAGDPHWSLGVLRPLEPRAPGTRRYRVVFAEWHAIGDEYHREDVHVLDLWACDGRSARRQAQAEILGVEGYHPSWRIRAVSRIADEAA